MRISVAQIRPLTGDIEGNIANHIKLIELAVVEQSDLVMFPELSLTGYEPKLAEQLATNKNDSRLKALQSLADTHAITISVGLPIRNQDGICISMIIFQPQLDRQIYSKQYLHADEEQYFICGPQTEFMLGERSNISPAICYELSIPAHADRASKLGAEVYLASVAKTAQGVTEAYEMLSEISRKYSVFTLMSNAVGIADGVECAGQSSIWNKNGELIASLDDTNDGILLIDIETEEIITRTEISTT